MITQIKNYRLVSRAKRVTVIVLTVLSIFSTPANAADDLLNPNFDAEISGWTGARQTGVGNSACSGGFPNIGTWENGKLAFSYVRNTVFQDVVITVPSRVTIFFEAQNRGDQIYTRWFSASLGDATTGNFTPPYLLPFSASLTIRTTEPNQVVRVAFRGQDQLFWAGCYGTRVGNLTFVVDKNTTVAPIGQKSRSLIEGAELRIGNFSKVSRGF